MKSAVVLVVGLFALIVLGCAGEDVATVTTGTPTTATTSGNGGGSSSGFDLSTAAGSYSGDFSGSNTQALAYSGSGTATIQPDGTTHLGYAAKTSGGTQVQENRSFSGTVDSGGNFSGTTPILDFLGNVLKNVPASGSVTQVSATQIRIKVTWGYPYANGGTFYTSTENWTLTKSG
ncbi:MAG TPA: hypothetical protein VG944_21465 [Fimbriimonas sp.]|nr:hypothetical protein [Fimbriimonas sp.]